MPFSCGICGDPNCFDCSVTHKLVSNYIDYSTASERVMGCSKEGGYRILVDLKYEWEGLKIRGSE